MHITNEMKYTDWCTVEKDEVYRSIFAQIHDFDESYYGNGSSTDFASGLNQYYSMPLGLGSKSYNYKNSLQFSTQIAVPRTPVQNSFNATALCIDTLTAKLAAIRAVPQAVTDRGTAKGRRLAEDLNYLIKGLFHKLNINHLLNLAFKEAMVNRVGYLKVIVEEEGVKIDQIFSDEVIVDPVDGYYNNPYKMIHRKLIPKHVMLDLFPDFEEEIMVAEEVEVTSMNTSQYTPSIMVAEAWCKNTYKKKGRHVLCISNADLVDEDWDKDYFPIIKCDFNPPMRGYIGQSLVDQLCPLQEEITKLMGSIARIINLVAVPRVFIDTMSNVSKDHFTNSIGIVLEFTSAAGGAAPIIHNGSALAPEIMQYLEFNVSQIYAQSGLTDVDTQGMQQVGSGNTSGEAIKKQTDIRSERWQFLKGMYEDKHIEVADVLLAELQGKKIKVSSLDRSIGMRMLNTSVIPNIRDSYVIKMYPVSSLPSSIPDLMDSFEQMMKLGLIQKSQLYDMFDMPDLDSKVALMSAKFKVIDMILDKMLEEGEYTNPEPYFDLQYAAVAAYDQYNWALFNEVAEDKLALVRRFINDVKKLVSQATPPSALPVTPAPSPVPPMPIPPQQPPVPPMQ